MEIPNNSDPHVQQELRKNPRRTVAVVFLIADDGKFLFVRTKRLPNQWQPIGGGVKPTDSSVARAAAREVEEEVGLQLSESDLREIFSTPYDFGEGSVHFFTANLPNTSVLSFDTAELEEWRWVSLRDALSLSVFPATGRCLQYLASQPEVLGDYR